MILNNYNSLDELIYKLYNKKVYIRVEMFLFFTYNLLKTINTHSDRILL